MPKTPRLALVTATGPNPVNGTVDRFWSKVRKGDGCWLWTGPPTTTGYGVFYVGGKTIKAHQAAWILTHGAIPDGLFVLHNCPGGDTPLCVRPDHLWLGTQADNMADAARKWPRAVLPIRHKHPARPDGGISSRPPRRLPNAARRGREHLTPDEAERLIEAAGRRGRHGHRDSTMLLLCYRHGLRVGELVALRWDAVDLAGGHLHVSRLKRGVPSTHPLRGPELRALRRLQREQKQTGGYVFTSERGGPLTTAGVRKIVTAAGEAAGLGPAIHPHQLRHGCGYALAADGQDTRAIAAYLGHRRLENTARYTELAPGRFKDFWRD